MSKKVIIVATGILLGIMVNAQNSAGTLNLDFRVKFDNVFLQKNKLYVNANRDSLTIDVFKCYISGIEIEYADRSVFKENNSYHLLDLEKPESFVIHLKSGNEKTISKVRFRIGIDSLTSTSGALDGDLDPAKGMYWAWQSGYINMKIEGKSQNCHNRKKEFQFHLGGYLQPFYALREIELPYTKRDTQIPIIIDLSNYFANIDLAHTNSVMIPGKEAMQLADYSIQMFRLE